MCPSISLSVFFTFAMVLPYPGPTLSSKRSSLRGACSANEWHRFAVALMFTSCLCVLLGAAESVACARSHHVLLWEAGRAGQGVCPALSGCGGEAAGPFPEAGAVTLQR